MEGDLPKGWALRTLGHITRQRSERAGTTDLPVLSVTNSAGFVRSDEYFDKRVFSTDVSDYKIVRRGDFAYNPSRINVGSIALLESHEGGLLSPMYVVFCATNEVDTRFLLFWLESGLSKHQIQSSTQGSVRDSVNYAALASLKIALPPRSEQERIVEMLESVDAMIQSTQATTAQIRRVKHGLLRDLMTRGIGHTSFKQTEIGILPEGWDVAELGRVAEIGNGTTPSRQRGDYWEGGTIPWIASGKVNDVRIYSESEFVTEKALTECSIRLLPPETVLVAMIGQGRTRGMTAQLKIPAAINQNLAYAIPGERLDASFLFAYLSSQYEALRRSGRGSNQDALNCSILKQFAVPVPGLSEQREIAMIAARIDDTITANQQSAAQMNALKTGLTRDLLTGRVRVPASV